MSSVVGGLLYFSNVKQCRPDGSRVTDLLSDQTTR